MVEPPDGALARVDDVWVVAHSNQWHRATCGLDDLLADMSTWPGVVADAPVLTARPNRAPIGSQGVWGAGVTYRRSRDERIAESGRADIYSAAYRAERPELFVKATAPYAAGSQMPIGVRSDSDWTVPEAELGVVFYSTGAIAGLVLGNDVTARDIEAANPLYLSQAKVYDDSLALGPWIVPVSLCADAITLEMTIQRRARIVFRGHASSSDMVRTFEQLGAWLFAAHSFPVGVVLLTGTGIIPEPDVRLEPDDVVRIDGGILGELENRVRSVGPSSTGAAAKQNGP